MPHMDTDEIFATQSNQNDDLRAIKSKLGLPETASTVGILMKIGALKNEPTPVMVSYAGEFDERTGREDQKLNDFAEYLATLGAEYAKIRDVESRKIFDVNRLEHVIIERHRVVGELNEAGRFLKKTAWKPGGFVFGNKK